MRGLIVDDPEPVLDPAEKSIALIEQLDLVRRCHTACRGGAERGERRGRRERRVRMTERELEVLRDELDVDDATGPELEIGGGPPAGAGMCNKA